MEPEPRTARKTSNRLKKDIPHTNKLSQLTHRLETLKRQGGRGQGAGGSQEAGEWGVELKLTEAFLPSLSSLGVLGVLGGSLKKRT